MCASSPSAVQGKPASEWATLGLARPNRTRHGGVVRADHRGPGPRMAHRPRDRHRHAGVALRLLRPRPGARKRPRVARRPARPHRRVFPRAAGQFRADHARHRRADPGVEAARHDLPRRDRRDLLRAVFLGVFVRRRVHAAGGAAVSAGLDPDRRRDFPGPGPGLQRRRRRGADRDQPDAGDAGTLAGDRRRTGRTSARPCRCWR